MKNFLLGLVAFTALASSAQAYTAPATIDPTLWSPTFQENFATLSEGPDQAATTKPLHTWRTILKGWTGGSSTPPTLAEDACCTMTATTWLGYDGDGQGSTAITVGANGLAITATKRTQPFGHTWRSAIINTKFSFSQLYGYFEVNANLPTCVAGTWPGIWLMPESGTWPAHGEIDWPEVVGTGHYYWTIHDPAIAGQQTQVSSPANCTRGYHKYGVLWEPDTITYYVDRQIVGQVPTPIDFTIPMYLLIDLNVGGSWTGNPAASLTYEQMLVSNVSVWQPK